MSGEQPGKFLLKTYEVDIWRFRHLSPINFLNNPVKVAQFLETTKHYLEIFIYKNNESYIIYKKMRVSGLHSI